MQLAGFATFNVAIIVLAAGKLLTRRVRLLRNFSIREPVSSGLLVCLLVALQQRLTGLKVPVLLTSTTSPMGGHGTAIAWAPCFAEQHGISIALEIGAACATFGLVLSGLMGGPLAGFLIRCHRQSIRSWLMAVCLEPLACTLVPSSAP